MSEGRSRFDGIVRLYGAGGARRLAASHVGVIGIGGVGSWAVEALARSGVGRLTLVDMDDVCISNVNRQVPAIEGSIGRPKVEAMAERVRAINPDVQVEAIAEYFTATTAEGLLQRRYDVVVDAIDDVANKTLLIARAHAAGLRLVTTGAAGGRRDPTRIECADLARAHHDRLLLAVRKRLRREHGFPSEGEAPFGISAVFSGERLGMPVPGDACGSGATGAGHRLNCDFGYGSAAFVTGAFGFVAAAEVVRQLVAERRD